MSCNVSLAGSQSVPQHRPLFVSGPQWALALPGQIVRLCSWSSSMHEVTHSSLPTLVLVRFMERRCWFSSCSYWAQGSPAATAPSVPIAASTTLASLSRSICSRARGRSWQALRCRETSHTGSAALRQMELGLEAWLQPLGPPKQPVLLLHMRLCCGIEQMQMPDSRIVTVVSPVAKGL